MGSYLDRSDRKLERAEILTPAGSKAALELMRSSGERDHRGEVLGDGTRVLVTPAVVAVRSS